ncbi:MAG: type I-C CRISPR-associated protein Cas8c/Csd1, partial [Gammaproteobacteria bacterium]|nr:type I-C CRISPR-associated protein Cas8c/Csd1 [Gammaproteobacteria bacterium]
MILQALTDYYQRKTAEPGSGLAEPGFELKALPFIIEITRDGELVQIEDTREGTGNKKTAQSFLLPQGVKKTSGVATNLLWDNLEYVLGVDKNSGELDDIEAEQQRLGEVEKRKDRVREQHLAFVEKIRELPDTARADEGLRAVLTFLDRFEPEQIKPLSLWQEIPSNPTMSFRLQGDIELVCQREAVIESVRALSEKEADADAPSTCLISGEACSPERLHTAIKGVWGAQSSGANIVSFNL